MLWFLELPDAPLALVFAFLPVPEVGELLLTHKASLGRLGPERTELWKMLFEAHGLRPPSKRARRANSNLRRAFFDVFRAQYPSDFVLLHRLEKCFRGGDSPKQLAALLPPPEFLKVNRQFDLMGGATIVGLAARWRRTRCVQYLVARGSDVNIADDQGFTVLGNAAWGGNLRLVRWLLRNVPDLDLDQQGCTHKTSSCGGKGPHKPEVWAYRKQFFEVAAAITEERRRRERRRKQRQAPRAPQVPQVPQVPQAAADAKLPPTTSNATATATATATAHAAAATANAAKKRARTGDGCEGSVQLKSP